jgi:hypothetical protein
MYIFDTTFASRQIYLNSLHADYINGLTSDVIWHLRDPLIVPQNIDILLSVVDAQIPHSVYSINSSNDTLSYNVGGSGQQVKLPHGNLGANDVISFVNSNQGDMTISADFTTNKFKIVSSSVVEITAPFFGFVPMQTGNTIIATNCFRFGGITSILVGSNFILDSVDSYALHVSNIIARIPVDVPPGGFISYTNSNMYKQHLGSDYLSTIQLSLLDEDRNRIDLHGLHWSVTIQLDFIKRPMDDIERTLKTQHLDDLDAKLTADLKSVSKRS